MSRKPPDPGAVGIGKVLLALCIFASISAPASAQQQHLSQTFQLPNVAPSGKSTWVEQQQHHQQQQQQQDANPAYPHVSEVDDSNILNAAASTRDETKPRSSNKNTQKKPLSEDARAVIPYAPAERLNRDTVEAPAQPAAVQSGGFSSRLPARSLQDWKVEDVVLLATVDGNLYARNRNNGRPIWVLEADKPMVETIYGVGNDSITDQASGTPLDEFLWIVEPSQDGALYLYNPLSGLGLQNLHLTVKQLAEYSPWHSDYPPVHYTAEKKNTIYKVDIATGAFLQVAAPSRFVVSDPGVCRQIGELDSLDDDQCGAVGSLTLTRTEYTIGIFREDSFTGQTQVCTLKYSEWGPNNRDKDLHDQYLDLKDDQFIHGRYNGEIYAIDRKNHKEPPATAEKKPNFWGKLSSPLARVFDVARPLESASLDAPLVLLPQPLDPIQGLKENQHNVFVNCTENGSWYALSDVTYPLATGGALPAKGLGNGRITSSMLLKDALVGVHSLSSDDSFSASPAQIGGSAQPSQIGDGRSIQSDEPRKTPETISATPAQTLSFSYTQIILALTIIFLSGYGLRFWSQLKSLTKHETLLPEKVEVASTTLDSLPQRDINEAATVTTENDLAKPKAVKFDDKSLEITKEASNDDKLSELSKDANEEVSKTSKKKTHRGSRGGRREAERRALAADKRGVKGGPLADGADGVVDDGRNVSLKPDIIYQTTDENAKTPAGLLNLEITNNILGHGSGGTLVFEGKFEGRDVAVKRMLGQYSELASQEVSLLEQSEDHPNVIRYFCRRQDENFLYIALELCQASLWELYRDGRREEVQDKFRDLADEVNSQPNKVLRQLAEGLKHLHSFRIVHRDIKPQNMLIAYHKKHTPSKFPRLVISDFGLCKTLPEGASTLIGATVNAGTIGWKAPELISQPKESHGQAMSNHSTGRDSTNGDFAMIQGIKRSTDVFSLGCVFFYILTHGLHPFDDEEGWMGVRERNIKENRCNLDGISLHGPDTVDLIRWMLEPNPEARPTAAEVLAHPFFWNAEDRLEFLSVASDRFDMEARDGASIIELESHAEEIIGAGPTTLNLSSLSASSRYNTSSANGHQRSSSSHSDTTSSMNIPMPGEPNFLAALDKKFIDTLGKQRKYQGHKVVDLLRALRNKHHHWDDMPDDVKQRVGVVPEGYLRYWEQRFPKITVAIWRVVKQLGMSEERRFWRWYGARAV